LVIEENGVRIMTDPGAWTTAQNEVKNIDIILITHEHPDHLHVESVKKVLENNPSATLITNSAVGKILASENIQHEILENGGNNTVKNIGLEAHGEKHATIYEDFGQVQNTGYLVAGRLFYPGDAFFNPEKSVEILALPVAGPWLKISEAVDYAIELKPRIAFPVHDEMINTAMFSGHHAVPQMFLPKAGIDFQAFEKLKEYQF